MRHMCSPDIPILTRHTVSRRTKRDPSGPWRSLSPVWCDRQWCRPRKISVGDRLRPSFERSIEHNGRNGRIESIEQRTLRGMGRRLVPMGRSRKDWKNQRGHCGACSRSSVARARPHEQGYDGDTQFPKCPRLSCTPTRLRGRLCWNASWDAYSTVREEDTLITRDSLGRIMNLMMIHCGFFTSNSISWMSPTRSRSRLSTNQPRLRAYCQWRNKAVSLDLLHP